MNSIEMASFCLWATNKFIHYVVILFFIEKHSRKFLFCFVKHEFKFEVMLLTDFSKKKKV